MLGVLFSPLIMLSAAQAQIIPSFDPPPARPWEQSLLVTCGGTTLRIAGYGAAQPANRIVEITVNGRPLAGDDVAALRRDLSHRAGAYRLGARCPRERSSIALIINLGEKQDSGVLYQRGSGLIVRGRLQSYTGLQPTPADAFWFR